MSLETELTAILTAAAIAPITDKAFLRITGPDATRWLNGMVTNNIKDLAPGKGNYNFLLNAQGRIQGDCTIYRELGDAEPSFLLEADTLQIDTIRQILDRFIIMDDVELEVVRMTGVLLIGPDSRQYATQVLDPVLIFDESNAPSDIATGKVFRSQLWSGKLLALCPPAGETPTVEIWSSEHDQIRAITKKLQGCPVVEIASHGYMVPPTLEAYRILSGTPRYGTDIRNTDTAKDLPQETTQTHALNFNKGCYLGQEIVERIHSRGQVHRTFARFELTGDLPTLHCQLTLDGKAVGELTSAALIPLASGPTLRALGYIRREAATATLTYPGGTAKVLST